MDIDLIYLWVDGNDPEWLKKKMLVTGVPWKNSETDSEGRYANNDELKYALRSAERFAPWIRRIFIVTDNQIPGWLNVDHPKIRIVDHTEILPAEVLPTFNSSAIEYNLHRIPDLSEHFLYSNDDMFFNAAVSPDFFFKEGKPIVRLKRKRFGKLRYQIKKFLGKPLNHYREKVQLGVLAVERKFGKYYSGLPHHNIDAYNKSDYQKAVEEIFQDRIVKSQQHRVRKNGDLQRSVFLYYALAVGRAHLRYVGNRESMRILIYQHDFVKNLKKNKPEFFCLNDDEHVTAAHREKLGPLLEEIFPGKSAFEK